jgi:hypothetical protein
LNIFSRQKGLVFILLNKLWFILDNSDDVIASDSYAKLYESTALTKEVTTALSKELVECRKRKCNDGAWTTLGIRVLNSAI